MVEQMVGGMVSAPPQHQDRSLFKVLLESAANIVLETAARKFFWCAAAIPNQVCDASKEHTSGLVIAGQLAAQWQYRGPLAGDRTLVEDWDPAAGRG